MIYELRIYDAMPGKLPALVSRFGTYNVGLFTKYGIEMVGFWTDEIGTSNQLTYMLRFDSMGDREGKWGTCMADADWRKYLREEAAQDGLYVDRSRNTFMRLTDYSPEPRITTDVQELRIYDATPGKLPDLHNRFANHTTRLFKKHGMEVIGYWTDDVGLSNRLVYMLGYSSLGDREKTWASFGADGEWQKARAESEVNGPLVRKNYSTILRPTSYSPRG